MAENSKIEWCDSTFNPWIGCTRVSPACDDCYAARSTPARVLGVAWGPREARYRTSPNTWRQPVLWEREHEAFAAQHGRRRRVFCASLADVFDNMLPDEWREDLWRLIEATPNLDWLLLTKRIGNVGNMLPVPFDFERLYPHVWIGATVVNQQEADRDIPKLLAVPARVRFLSIEPMLGPISFEGMFANPQRVNDGTNALEALDWVIAGGESGPHARPSRPNWYRSLRDQCAAAGVPFMFKQWGEFLPAGADGNDPSLADVPESRIFWSDGSKWDRFDGQRGGVDIVARVGRKAAGRLLDGVTHDGMPA